MNSRIWLAGAISRRTLLEAGGCALISAASVPQMTHASADTGPRSRSEAIVRKYYAAWETKRWRPLDMLLTDDFTFSSPLDDHISKGDFKAGCWDTQIAHIDRFDLTQVVGTDNQAFVMYIGHTMNGKTFRNVEYFQFREDKVQAVECYFGGKSSFASAASTGTG